MNMLNPNTSRLSRWIRTRIRTPLFLSIICITTAGAREHPTQLPQDYAYQVVLRDYLATFEESDFEVELQPVSLDLEAITDLEELHKLWLLFGPRRDGGISDTKGLTIAADNFVLENIETDEGVMIRAGHRGGQKIPGFSIQPADTAWWALWDHPGNPYRGSREVRNRAFVVAAADMIMLDHLHESGTHWVANARRSDFLGGTMIWLTYVYQATRDDLPPEVREAYETGLGKFLDLLTKWGPTGVNDNMDMKANVSMATIMQMMPNTEMAEQAANYIRRNLKRVHPAGMIRDAGGLEASYNGIGLVNIIWATQIGHMPELVEVTQRMHDLKGHLILPEPNRNIYFGPSHFSTRTGNGSPNDQWSQSYRDIAASMLSEDALYLMAGGRNGRGPRYGFPDAETMRQQSILGLASINKGLAPLDERFGRWEAGWWPGRINYAHDFYRPGYYQDMMQRHEANDPMLQAPFVRPGNRFIRVYPEPGMQDIPEHERDTFLSTRFDEYGAIAYSGPIGRTRYMNFAGGGLSAFWTPNAGSIILGRVGYPVDPNRTHQTWSDWRLWPTHALSGTTADGKSFSSARIRRRVLEVNYETGENDARIRVSGPIGAHHDDGRAVQNGNINGEVGFRRDMLFNNEGIVIESALYTDGRDDITELYEILPLFLGDSRRQKVIPEHRVLCFANGTWTEASVEPLEGVQSVRVERGEGGLLIDFDTPRRVRLSPEVWEDNYQSRAQLRNLMIDLRPAEDGPIHKVRYRIRPLATSQQALTEPTTTVLPTIEFQAGDFPQDRRLAVIAAAGSPDPDMEMLQQALNDTNKQVRLTTVRSLASTGNAGLSLLRETIQSHEDFATRHCAMEVLSENDLLTYQELFNQVAPAILGDENAPPSPSEAILHWATVTGRHTGAFYKSLFAVNFDQEGYRPIGAELSDDTTLERIKEHGIALHLPAVLDGKRQYALRLPRFVAGPTPAGAFTLELWINPEPESFKQSCHIIDKFGAASHGGGYGIMLRANKEGELRLSASLGFGKNDTESLQSELIELPANTWSHVSFTYDGNGLAKLYLNQQLIGEAKFENRGPIQEGRHPMTIGDRAVGSFSHFLGKITGVRIREGVNL